MATYENKLCYIPLYRVSQAIIDLQTNSGATAEQVYYQSQIVCDKWPLTRQQINETLADGVRRRVLSTTSAGEVRYKVNWDMTQFGQNETIYADLLANLFTIREPVSNGVNYFVSPNGDDSWSGALNQPFATLAAAKRNVQAVKAARGIPSGGITVYLRGGEYYLTEPFQLTSVDSGTAGTPITYSSYPGETAR